MTIQYADWVADADKAELNRRSELVASGASFDPNIPLPSGALCFWQGRGNTWYPDTVYMVSASGSTFSTWRKHPIA